MADGNYHSSEKGKTDKIKEITEKLEEGVKELFESDKYKNYLKTMSQFYRYSLNNTILIAMQKPDATLVAGFKQWENNFERHVKKGEKGIRILAPSPYTKKVAVEKVDPVTKEISSIENKIPEIRKDIQLKENVTNYVAGDADEPEIEQTAGIRM